MVICRVDRCNKKSTGPSESMPFYSVHTKQPLQHYVVVTYCNPILRSRVLEVFEPLLRCYKTRVTHLKCKEKGRLPKGRFTRRWRPVKRAKQVVTCNIVWHQPPGQSTESLHDLVNIVLQNHRRCLRHVIHCIEWSHTWTVDRQ